MSMRIRALLVAGSAIAAASTLGCGAAEDTTAEVTGTSEQATLPATVIHPYGQDERRYWDDGDWSEGFWKGECALNENVNGVSRVLNPNPNGGAMHGIRCLQRFNSNGAPGSTLDITQHDHRPDTNLGDWHFGYIKAECRRNEVVAGISQSADYEGVIAHVKCNAFNQTFTTRCHRVDISDGYIPLLIWDGTSNAQNNCREGEVVRGISKSDNSSGGQVRSLLCCTPDPIV